MGFNDVVDLYVDIGFKGQENIYMVVGFDEFEFIVCVYLLVFVGVVIDLVGYGVGDLVK